MNTANKSEGRCAWPQWFAMPSRCRICHSWPSQTLCADCMAVFSAPVARCLRCAVRLPSTLDGKTCLSCLRNPPPQSCTLTFGDYSYPWSFLLSRLKFGDDIGLGRKLGQLMASTPGLAGKLENADWIVPLPLSRQRLAERGYNQSLILARAVMSRFPVEQRHKLRPSLLEKPLHTPAQHELPRSQRLDNVRHAYRIPENALPRISGSHVLVIDDVMTTGASLQAAASTLLRNGAKEVSTLVLARA